MYLDLWQHSINHSYYKTWQCLGSLWPLRELDKTASQGSSGCVHAKHGRTPTTVVRADEKTNQTTTTTNKNVHGNSLLGLTEATKGVHTKHDPTRHVTDGTSSIVHALFFPSVHVKRRNFPCVSTPLLPLWKKKKDDEKLIVVLQSRIFIYDTSDRNHHN